MDPRKIQFAMSEPREQPDDPKNEGLACAGCLFRRQRSSVCRIAGQEAIARGMRDCDRPDQFGQYIVYERVDVDPRQLHLLEGETDVQETE